MMIVGGLKFCEIPPILSLLKNLPLMFMDTYVYRKKILPSDILFAASAHDPQNLN